MKDSSATKDSVVKKEFAQKLKSLRKNIGITQTLLGKEIGIGDTTISSYERANSMPDYETMKKIANYFSVSVDWLMGRHICKENTLNENDKINVPFIPIENETLKNFSISMPFEMMGSGDFFAIELQDDALCTSDFKKNDVLLFLRTSDINDGDLAFVKIAGKNNKDDIKLIRFIYRSNGTITLVASEKTKPLFFLDEQVTVLGVAKKALINIK